MKNEIKCMACSKIFIVSNSRKNKAKYCSIKCMHNSISWKKMMSKQAKKIIKKHCLEWKKLKKPPKIDDCIDINENKKHKHLITKKGKNWLKQEKDYLDEQLSDLKRFGNSNYAMYYSKMPAIQDLLKEAL